MERKENERGKINVTLVIKNKAEGIVQKWLGFFKRNLNKIANLNQKTCKETKMKVKLKNVSITSLWSLWYKISKRKLNKVSQSKPCYNSMLISLISWLCYWKVSSLFQMIVLDFVSEILFNIFLLFTRKLCFVKFCLTSLTK